jgi:hypothetical protein
MPPVAILTPARRARAAALAARARSLLLWWRGETAVSWAYILAVAVGVAGYGAASVFLFGPDVRRWRKRRRLGGMIL